MCVFTGRRRDLWHQHQRGAYQLDHQQQRRAGDALGGGGADGLHAPRTLKAPSSNAASAGHGVTTPSRCLQDGGGLSVGLSGTARIFDASSITGNAAKVRCTARIPQHAQPACTGAGSVLVMIVLTSVRRAERRWDQRRRRRQRQRAGRQLHIEQQSDGACGARGVVAG